ncbi:hypothetical protein CTAYLR_002654 [Chrysophaeum taylorii]|uniref:Xaa-Pro dipeptidyl-peptidase-like domain-containing protein n=1 Tax=Chrysophaeum taylorii TaxID=2483200 RepID=A0AAD7UBG1_9STRA|nr:hypothetical protein CTAYLR_002654 [Chrysophaeum taylorii]
MWGWPVRNAVWLRLECGSLAYYEPSAAQEATGAPAGGGSELGRLRVSRVDVRADVDEAFSTACLVLTASEGAIRLLFSTMGEMRAWWLALTRSRRLARQPEELALPREPSEPSEPNLFLRKNSVFGPVFEAYDEVLRVVIRPPRASYDRSHLGPEEFSFFGSRVTRTDFAVENKRGQRIACSRWIPQRRADDEVMQYIWGVIYQQQQTEEGLDDDEDDDDGRYLAVDESLDTVVYVHGNASCRVEAISPALAVCLSLNLSLLALDLSGSGHSDGEFVSLGYYEREDVAAVVDFLASTCGVARVGLWGRSMGATTSLLYASTLSPDAACVVSDSAFSSLETLCLEQVQRCVAPVLPRATFKAVVDRVAASVQYYANFSICDVDPARTVLACATPCFIVHGALDDLVKCETHAYVLFDNFEVGADVDLIVEPQGKHLTPRTAETISRVRAFLFKHMRPTFVPIDDSNFAARDVAAPPWSDVWRDTTPPSPRRRPVHIQDPFRRRSRRRGGDVQPTGLLLLHNEEEPRCCRSAEHRSSSPPPPETRVAERDDDVHDDDDETRATLKTSNQQQQQQALAAPVVLLPNDDEDDDDHMWNYASYYYYYLITQRRPEEQ